MTELYLGVDGGGTKTHAAVMDITGEITGFAVGKTGNPERVGYDGAVEVIQVVIEEALDRSAARPSDVVAATVALAGIDWDSDATALALAGNGFGLDCAPNIVNDAVAVLFAGTRDGVGCASVAGTGGKVAANDGSDMLLTLGLGIGEAGGARQLIDEALAILAQTHHGQRQPSALQEAVLDETGSPNVSELFRAIVRDGRRLSAAFAPTLFDLAAQGDPSAVDAVDAVARRHAADVVGLVDQLQFDRIPVPVVCAGGLHTADSGTFRGAFESGLAAARWPLAPLVLDVVPVVGSLAHAVISAEREVTDQQRFRMRSSVRRWPDER